MTGTLLATSLLAESYLLGGDSNPVVTNTEQSASIPPQLGSINPDTGMIVAKYEGSAPMVASDTVIPRCFSRPLAPQYDFNAPGAPPLRKMYKDKASFDRALNKYFSTSANANSAKVMLSMPVVNGRPDGMPKNSSSGTVLKSLARITTKEYQGSGFTSEDAHGKDVVVTAAHVGAKARLKDISITAMNGRTVHPTGGCYINEEISYVNDLAVESFSEFPKDDGVSNIDVAVLTIPQTLGTTALGFVNNQVSRGDWVQFNNFELGSTLEHPANYYGLVTSSPQTPLEAITGITYAANTTLNRGAPGDSGGLDSVGNRVAAISFAGDDKPGRYLSEEDMTAEGISFPGAVYGFTTNFAPANAFMIGSQTIQIALSSEKA